MLGVNFDSKFSSPPISVIRSITSCEMRQNEKWEQLIYGKRESFAGFDRYCPMS
jgi:hypothetical protein